MQWFESLSSIIYNGFRFCLFDFIFFKIFDSTEYEKLRKFLQKPMFSNQKCMSWLKIRVPRYLNFLIEETVTQKNSKVHSHHPEQKKCKNFFKSLIFPRHRIKSDYVNCFFSLSVKIKIKKLRNNNEKVFGNIKHIFIILIPFYDTFLSCLFEPIS